MSETKQAFSPATNGLHHLGLAVPDVKASISFFCDVLGYKLLGERPDYPAAFVSDGTTMLTLWQVEDPATATPFDRRKNIGLHHFAMTVPSIDRLHALHQQLAARDDVEIEFEPSSANSAGAEHFICLIPGGLRMEFRANPEA